MRRRLIIVATIALVLAALAGPLVISLGADRGSAAFGDNEMLGMNQLASASVSVALGPTTVLFDARNMAPGDRFEGEVVFENDGTLPLRYALVADTSDSNRLLLEALEWRIWPAASGACGPAPVQLLFEGAASDPQIFGNPAIGPDDGDRLIQPGTTDLLCLDVEFPIDVSNNLQGAGAVVELTILAEQATEDLE